MFSAAELGATVNRLPLTGTFQSQLGVGVNSEGLVCESRGREHQSGTGEPCVAQDVDGPGPEVPADALLLLERGEWWQS